MEAGRNRFAIFALGQERFEFSNHVRIEHVLDRIGRPINLTGRDIGVTSQEKFPETMVVGKFLCFLETSPRKTHLARRIAANESL